MAKKSQLLIIAAAVASLAACNTVSGVGHDLQALGTAVTKAADDNAPRRHARRAAPAPSAQPTAARAAPAPAPAVRAGPLPPPTPSSPH